MNHLEKVKANDLGDKNQWRTGLPSLPTWKQKKKIHSGKRFHLMRRKEKLTGFKNLVPQSKEFGWFRNLRKVTLQEELSVSQEMKRRRMQVLVRLCPFRSLTPLCQFGVQPNLVQTKVLTQCLILDKPVASGSKENPESPSGSVYKVGMSSKKVRKSKSGYLDLRLLTLECISMMR